MSDTGGTGDGSTPAPGDEQAPAPPRTTTRKPSAPKTGSTPRRKPAPRATGAASDAASSASGTGAKPVRPKPTPRSPAQKAAGARTPSAKQPAADRPAATRKPSTPRTAKPRTPSSPRPAPQAADTGSIVQRPKTVDAAIAEETTERPAARKPAARKPRASTTPKSTEIDETAASSGVEPEPTSESAPEPERAPEPEPTPESESESESEPTPEPEPAIVVHEVDEATTERPAEAPTHEPEPDVASEDGADDRPAAEPPSAMSQFTSWARRSGDRLGELARDSASTVRRRGDDVADYLEKRRAEQSVRTAERDEARREAAERAEVERIARQDASDTAALERAAVADDTPRGELTFELQASADGSQPVLSVRGLSKSFGETVAVADVDLTVQPGAFYGIVGPNGAGKTTTLSMITGLLRPDAGTVTVNGADVWSDPVVAKRTMGVLPDRLRLFDRLTGAQLLFYAGVLRGLDGATVRSRITDLGRVFGMEDALARLVSDYSAGMTKKIALAAAMIHSPRLLVLDEPFESVDPVSAATVTAILKQYVQAGGTVVLSSHSMDLVQRICDHVAVVVDGVILADGTVDEVRDGRSLEERFVELVGGRTGVEGLGWLHSFSD